MTDPVRVTFAGVQISATPVEKLPDGSWFMRSCVKHDRFDIGHLIRIMPGEFIDPIQEDPNAMDPV